MADDRAVISDDGLYRYALRREIPAQLEGEFVCPVLGPCKVNDGSEDSTWFTQDDAVLFVMLNPSTADAHQDDPTIRRCLGFARRWGFGRLVVANLYAYRSTNPDTLSEAADPVGPENDDWICQLANEASLSIAAWGAHKAADAGRIRDVVYMLDHDSGVYSLGLTASGAPRHPLYVPGDAQLVDYGLEHLEAAHA